MASSLFSDSVAKFKLWKRINTLELHFLFELFYSQAIHVKSLSLSHRN